MPHSTCSFSSDVSNNQTDVRLEGGNRISFVRVFPAGEGGGNPAPVVLDADDLSSNEMMSVARAYGHESAFVCTPDDPKNTFRVRFFVPNHEMEMCGHATLGALWLLRRSGNWTSRTATVETVSGLVTARFDADARRIEVSQPEGTVKIVDDLELVARTLDVLNLRQDDLLSLDIVNATTSRTKTLIPVASVERLHQIRPRLEDVQALCDALDSTGLYPFAVDSAHPLRLHARQFPRSSGYPEDAATGIAAAATLYGVKHYGLLQDGETGITVMQGFAMGKPSSIQVEFRDAHQTNAGCWISGAVALTELEARP